MLLNMFNAEATIRDGSSCLAETKILLFSQKKWPSEINIQDITREFI